MWNISNKKDRAGSGTLAGSLLLHEEHDRAFPLALGSARCFRKCPFEARMEGSKARDTKCG